MGHKGIVYKAQVHRDHKGSSPNANANANYDDDDDDDNNNHKKSIKWQAYLYA